MCPNCFPNSEALAPGYIIALAVCGIFFLSAVIAMLIASKSGHLENLEETKFRMLDD